MPEQTLKAYQVGDNDIVAAYNEAGAIKILCLQCGYPEDGGDWTVEDVQLVSDEILDETICFDQDEGKFITLDKSLRQELAELTGPEYMTGWE
ncbi:hypothetical protein JVX91_00735 [Pseudomonas sp. PDNC002]|uniref:hypothetical protein n=1 Tax=Pseudomonas sp. PDNC002 TaxID=2811422 RepID=UPI001965CF10|nr:hypothetical protein [Pseudomonas sp. PDNC002]QRY79672.1 hypothetical protein JVX91_00735 [Pseudomonas sp. PDNC002]